MENFSKDIHLDKNIPVPLYYQLKTYVLAMLQEGKLKEGDMIPPESELCDALGVSRPTIRQAFNELVAEGHLARYKGRGTFVSKPKVEEHFFSMLETFNSEMREKNMVPHTRVLSISVIRKPHEAHKKLELEHDEPVIYLSRLRSGDDIPLVYVETYLPYEKFPRLTDVDFSEKSLYESLEELYGAHICRVQRVIEAVNARNNEAKLLKIAPGKAVSLVKTVGYASDMPKPVEFSVARYRGDLNKFTVDIHR